MMTNLHLIMPMGGAGTRFGDKDFKLPKPLINLQGKPFFYWAVQSVCKFVAVKDITFVVLQEHIDKYQIDKAILSYYPDAQICVIPQVLKGAVLTCIEGVQNISDDAPLLFNDCDHAFISSAFNKFVLDGCQSDGTNSVDGALLTFNSDKQIYSYVEFDDDGRVIRTIEKEVVSNEAICGAYYFGNKDIFLNAAQAYLKECEYAEFFTSGLYNELVKSGLDVCTFKLDEHISFGIPSEYQDACSDERLQTLE